VVRGALVSMIYSKTLRLKLSGSQDAPAVTLMSADVIGITSTVDALHDIWANTIEVGIGMYLLWVYGGIGFIIPLFLGFISMGINYFMVGKKMVGYRKVFSEATQQRLGLTGSALRDMKSLRMMGLGSRLQSLLQRLRIRELHRMKGLRMMAIWMNIVGGLTPSFSPPFVLMVYSVRARASGWPPLNAAQAYTILSIISLTIEPLAMVLTRIPSTMSSLACFDRIQQYLLQEEQVDDRMLNNSMGIESEDQDSSGIELENIPSDGKAIQNKEAIILENISLGYSKDSDVVHSVTTTLKKNTITMIIGPVGAGKSSILLGMLGELRSNKGFIRLNARDIGYCSQSAWLPNATIKQIIAGTDEASDEVDEVWFRSVLHACVIDVDIHMFPQGEDSVIGSRGLTLSGGQRQRLALARAVYQRPGLMLLDDIFSALDAKTETLVFERLFSASGLFRRQATTVVLATHAGKYAAKFPRVDFRLIIAVRHLRSADHIIALGQKGNVIEQGLFAELDSMDGYIRSLAVAEAKKDQDESNEIEEEESPSSRVVAAPQVSYAGDDARRLGDLSVYNYYRKALTWSRIFVFVGLEAIFVPAYRFIRESLPPTPALMLTLLKSFWLSGGALQMATTLTCSFQLLSYYRPLQQSFNWATYGKYSKRYYYMTTTNS
jgi:ATP-binding cassette, subfamily C (CFTR/MRP), member 1